MQIVFSQNAWEDYLYWEGNNQNIFKQLNLLFKEIQVEPYKGNNDPIALFYAWKGYYSRRLNLRHRLVYKVEKKKIFVVQCKYIY